MKNKKLMDSFSLVDEELVAEADPSASLGAAKAKKAKKAKKANTLLKRVALPLVAACFMVAIILPVIFFGNFTGDNPTTTRSSLKDALLAPEGDLSFGVPEASRPDGSIGNGDSYTEIVENSFVSTLENNKSFFSIDVSTASFPNIRSTLKAGYKPDKNAYRVEEILNYFKFNYQTPTSGEVFALNASMFDTPYNASTKLLTIGLAAEAVEFKDVENNLVFLIDVSGSMYSANKLPLAQQAFSMLTDQLNPTDRVSIVTYAGSNQVALAGAYGYEKDKIKAVISDLSAGGSTAGAAGIQTAYQLAEEYFIEGGNNRVILMTDGDFNVGVSSNEGLVSMISEKRSSGVYFSVYGFGMGNWKSDKMEAMALAGNGMYSYIDSALEAKRALVDEIGGSMVVVAKDVKAGVTFNSEFIDSYRLIGYETKQMSEDEFNNTEKDAGEIGSGHTITVVYEIKLTEKAFAEDDSLGEVVIKYKTPDTSADKELSLAIGASVYHSEMTENDAFVASVVEFVLLARDSAYKGDASLDALINRLSALDFSDDTYKAEFREIVLLYRNLANQ